MKKIKDDVIPVICDLHIRGFSTTQISRELKAKGVQISQPSVWGWLNTEKNKPYIDRAKTAYRNDPEGVDIAHKRHRLEDLNMARDAIVKTLKTFISRDGTIIEKKINKFTSLARRLAEINIAGRDEMEKKPDMVSRKVADLEIPQEAILSELATIDRELGVKPKGTAGTAPASLTAGTETA